MSRFHGPQPGFKNPHNKGAMRRYLATKRQEALERAKQKRADSQVEETSEEETSSAEHLVLAG